MTSRDECCKGARSNPKPSIQVRPMFHQSTIVCLCGQEEQTSGHRPWPPPEAVCGLPRVSLIAAELAVHATDVVEVDFDLDHQQDSGRWVHREDVDEPAPSRVADRDFRGDDPSGAFQPAGDVGNAARVCPILHGWRARVRCEESQVDPNLEGIEDPQGSRDGQVGHERALDRRDHRLRQAADGRKPALRPSTSATSLQDRRRDREEDLAREGCARRHAPILPRGSLPGLLQAFTPSHQEWVFLVPNELSVWDHVDGRNPRDHASRVANVRARPPGLGMANRPQRSDSRGSRSSRSGSCLDQRRDERGHAWTERSRR
jgi:hypothetical protein